MGPRAKLGSKQVIYAGPIKQSILRLFILNYLIYN